MAKPSTEQNNVATTFRMRSRPVAGEDAGLEPLRRADQRVGGALAKAAGRGRCFRVCVDGGAGERRGGEVADLPLGGQLGQVIEYGDASVVRAGRLLRLLGRTSNGSSVVRSGRPRYRTRTHQRDHLVDLVGGGPAVGAPSAWNAPWRTLTCHPYFTPYASATRWSLAWSVSFAVVPSMTRSSPSPCSAREQRGLPASSCLCVCRDWWWSARRHRPTRPARV